MEKTRLEDLFVIIYRFNGLARKIPETHQTVLANRSNARVRSAKGARDRSVCKESKDLGGYAGTCKTHKKI
jgi:hypothetical protein